MISDKLLNEIGKMDMADLIELNHQVVSVIKHKRSHETLLKSLSFKVGDKVVFTSKRSGHKVGEIIKMNRTKAIVSVKNLYSGVAYANTQYSVPFSMLSKVPKGQ
jgi:co-chaperonin GroES (HSP10)